MRILLCIAALLILTVSFRAQPSQTPAFSAPDMNGAVVDTTALRGKVVVLNLWFINCPNCIEEIGLLNTLVNEYKDNRDVVFVSLAASKKADLVKFLQKYPFKYQTIRDATAIILGKFGTPDKSGNINMPFPMHFVLDRQGRIVTKEQGIKGVEVVKNELKKQFPAK